jgi:hypothetical protein
MSVTVPEFIDAFDARLYFVSSLKKLSVSQQTILKCRSFALRYTDWYEDLYHCIIEVMEGGSIWSRMYLLYFLDSLIERSEFVNFKGYTEFILEDLEKIVGLVCEKPEGSVNLVNTLKTLERWQSKNFFDHDVLEKAKASLLAWKSEPEYPPELNLTAAEIKQRMEDDRERAKLLREDSWWVDKSIEDGEALVLWEETSSLDEGDYIDIITENLKQDPNYDWKSLYEEVTSWNKEQAELEKEDERIAAMNRDFGKRNTLSNGISNRSNILIELFFLLLIESEIQPIKKLSKIPRPTQVSQVKFDKYQVSKSSKVPSKIPRLKRNMPTKKNPEESLISIEGKHHKTKEEFSGFEFTTVPMSITNLAIPRSLHRIDRSVPAIVISSPNKEIIPVSPCPEKSGIKRSYGTDDTFRDIPDERSNPKRARNRMPHEDPSTISGAKGFDSQEVRGFRKLRKN